MRTLLHIAVIFIALHQSYGYSKYGRTCKDIGCLNNEVCIMAEDPCSYYNRDQCGKYPTCQSSGSTGAPSCVGYACPPTQICHLDNGTPKCVAEQSSSTHVRNNENSGSSASQNPSYPAQNPSYPAQNPSYPAQNPSYPAQNPSYPAQNPSYPSAPYPNQPSSGGLYPSLTTTRPPMRGGYPANSGGGYAGGAPNSGYPGSPSGGYPQQSGYPSQYPNSGYPQNSGYPSQYPNQRNPSQGYPQYPNQGQGQYPGYSGYPAQSGTGYRQPGYGQSGSRYGNANSGSNPIVDTITDKLKTIGLFFVMHVAMRYINP